MNVGELKNLLEGVENDIKVYVYANHGQDMEVASSVQEDYVVEEEGDVYAVDEDDMEEYTDDVLSRAITIYGN